MTDSSFIEYAKSNGLTPIAWFEINYPSYAVKVKYKYPTSDPSDFRDRALLQMIDLGIPYSTACSILMIPDPHQSILQRFKSDEPGPQLVYFDKESNRLALTPMGRQRVEQIELARDGMSCCFIDGFSGHPFPIDVVNNLKDRYECKDVYNIPGGLYPYAADIEQKIAELNARVNDGKGRNYQKRLGIPENARETTMVSLGPKWMSNLSIGMFLKGTDIVRKIFCDDKINAISPFGWLENLDCFKLEGNLKNKKFSYVIDNSEIADVFVNNSPALTKLILYSIEKEYGPTFINGLNLEWDQNESTFRIFIDNIDEKAPNRSRILSIIDRGIMSFRLPGLTGSMFIEVKASESINSLGHLRKKIDKSGYDWHEIIEIIRNDYPSNWRQTLIAIDRHDIVFKHDIHHYIKYGK